MKILINIYLKLRFIIGLIKFIPINLLYSFSKNKEIINLDIERWIKIKKINTKYPLLYLFMEMPEFRNLFYRRIGGVSKMVEWIFPPMSTLHILAKEIGPGLFIQHGIATLFSAESIGENCWINQQVSIGYKNGKRPTIGNNVSILSGAKVLGDITIGDNSTIGANTVVTKSVPPNCTVIGSKAYIIKKDGVKTFEKL